MRMNPNLERAFAIVHPSWAKILRQGLDAIVEKTPHYFNELLEGHFFPTNGRIFSAFSQPIESIRYVLIGESPYPREMSASGYCFMDAAVQDIWSEQGLSKQVNRAVSLRNFIKMLLVADGFLQQEETGKQAIQQFVENILVSDQSFIRTCSELQANMLKRGFLLLNASLVFRKGIPVQKDVNYWEPFIDTILNSLSKYQLEKPIVLILWGKMAEKFQQRFNQTSYRVIVSEHPYNLSFIKNIQMQTLFQPLQLLRKNI